MWAKKTRRRKRWLRFVKALGNTPIDELKYKDIRFFLTSLKENSQSMIGKIYDLLKGSLNYAVANRILDTSPMGDLKEPTSNKKKKEKEVFELPELRTILEYAKNYKYPDVFYYLVLLLYTGIRRGEASSLQWTDIDHEKRLVDISRSASLEFEGETFYEKVPQKMVNSDPKTESSIREIAIASDLFFDLMNEWHECCKTVHKKTMGRFIFPADRGEQITPGGLGQRVTDFVAYYNLGDMKALTSHIMRHSIATLNYDTTTDELAVGRMLGHSNKNVTEHYIHSSLESKRDAITEAHMKLDEILRSL